MTQKEILTCRDKFIEEMVAAQITVDFRIVNIDLFTQSLHNLFELGQRLKELEMIR